MNREYKMANSLFIQRTPVEMCRKYLLPLPKGCLRRKTLKLQISAKMKCLLATINANLSIQMPKNQNLSNTIERTISLIY